MHFFGYHNDIINAISPMTKLDITNSINANHYIMNTTYDSTNKMYDVTNEIDDITNRNHDSMIAFYGITN
jgi:hypothetical protein